MYTLLFGQVCSIHWVDGGNGSQRGVVPSDGRALSAIHDLRYDEPTAGEVNLFDALNTHTVFVISLSNARLCVHVTPYQYESVDRPWIKQEILEFIQKMRRFQVDVRLKT